MTQTTTRRTRPGRPRHVPEKSGGLTPREHILDVATRLFMAESFAATSTREIADKVGIRQASLYYHFSGKEEILAEVLSKTIRPTLNNVDRVEELTGDSPEAALYLLVMLDVRTLVMAPHNSGLLGMFPDAAKVVPEFKEERAELAKEYARLGACIAPAEIVEPLGKYWGFSLMQQVETVIGWMAEAGRQAADADAVAGAVLRMCGCGEPDIELAQAIAHELYPDVVAELAD